MTKYMTISFALIFSAAGVCLAEEAAPIADNSFLIEEAYNQESRVVQHISAFNFDNETDSWEYTFTQEWPLKSQKHQLSYTVPAISYVDGSRRTGIGDILVHYRYQLVAGATTSFSPRLSVSIPIGDRSKGLTTRSVGLQANLPVSIRVGDAMVTHLNLGTTYIPSEHVGAGNSETTTSFNYGGSVIYLLSPKFNLMLELAGESVEIVGTGNSREESLFINPGLRFALDFESGLQIVPGIGFPIGVGPSEDSKGVFLYVSFEHPF
jgi:hypothetical protein